MKKEEIWDTLENKILPLVQKPARYIGGEVNSVSKNLSEIETRIALVFPDVYEVGMSNLGLKILYEEINKNKKYYAERAFCPWLDLEKQMRIHNVPMFSLETHSALSEFDIIGFSLQYDLCYTNVLTVIDLAGLPLHSKDRIEASLNYPLIIAGGLVSYTPEPISDFIDLFVVGDGEDLFVKIIDFYKQYGKTMSRKDFLQKIAKEMEFVYVPSLYSASPDSKGRFTNLHSDISGVPQKIKKHIVKDLLADQMPVKPIVPLIEVIHDRASVEIMRGCPRACRFCQAGVLYKPVRRRSAKVILDNALQCIKNTGYGEVGLLSLSSTDFGGIDELTDSLLKAWEKQKVSISLPSMRIDSFSLQLIDRISDVKKTGITLAPEAGSAKLLSIINKGYKPEDVIEVASSAYKLGYRVIKLYFMIGLPGEDFSDLDELIELLYKISKIGFMQVNVSISTMVPKPFTPFQWMDMIDLEKIDEKQQYIRSRIKKNKIKIKFHNRFVSILESIFGRGDRRLGDVIYKAWQAGERFDQWDECFRYDVWEKAMSDCGINMKDYLKNWSYDENLPWEHIDGGVEKEYLKKEMDMALNGLN
jgi:radical SAM family uncharacterized protein